MPQRVTHGADVDQLDEIAVSLRRQSERMHDVGGRGSALLEKLRALWDGPDFEEFSKEWRAAHRQIDDAEDSLRTYSRKLNHEADSQRGSSGGPSAGGAHGGGGALRHGGDGSGLSLQPTGGAGPASSAQGEGGVLRPTAEGTTASPEGVAFQRVPVETGFQPSDALWTQPGIGGGELLTEALPTAEPHAEGGELTTGGLPTAEPYAEGGELAFAQVPPAEGGEGAAFERVEAAPGADAAGAGGEGAAFEQVEAGAGTDARSGEGAAFEQVEAGAGTDASSGEGAAFEQVELAAAADAGSGDAPAAQMLPTDPGSSAADAAGAAEAQAAPATDPGPGAGESTQTSVVVPHDLVSGASSLGGDVGGWLGLDRFDVSGGGA
ncbi:hypothetical protein GCM10027055_17360 [Janibacter alkaliphilus]|uniref:Uncharacterized protein YukE n=1 Tax=Janibacter alkaliphilus TaxID=1069963 RepID=A0A852X6G1_9MICO|nr:hypothetical protein [Janibacter alkaliphilus]NYG35814.1 uncharacterized protein YukE [Janibacter alkaliphilus]